jgi:hypothetical protein
VAAERGTGTHEFVQRIAEGMPRPKALALVPDEARELCEALDLSFLDGFRDFAFEVALRYWPAERRAEELGRSIGRGYPAGDGVYIDGTADMVALYDDGKGVWIPDLKTGHSFQPRPRAHAQIRGLVAMAATAYGASYGRGTVIQVQEDGGVQVWTDEIDAWQLATDKAWLADLVVRCAAESHRYAAREPLFALRSGAWCHWCPAMHACPAMAGLALQLAEDPAKVVQSITGTQLDAETATRAYHRYKAAQTVLSKARDALYSYAAEHPIDLGNGEVLEQRETKRAVLDGETTYRTLRKLHSQEVAEAAVEFKATKAGVERAVRPLKDKDHTIASLKADALAAIQEAGGVGHKVAKTVKPYRKRG